MSNKITKCHLYILLAFLSLSLQACRSPTSSNTFIVKAPTLSSINIIDRNGLAETIDNPERLGQYANVDFLQAQPYKKVLRIYTRTIDGNIPSCITSYHPNGQPQQYLDVVNSRAFGAYKEWHPNGMQKLSATVIEGTADLIEGAERTWLFDGCSQVWDENGRLQASIPYSKGELEGVSTYFHSNGNVWKNVPYHKDRLEGIFETYCPDGTLLQYTNYSNGVKQGDSQRFWAPEVIAANETYCEGLLAQAQYYDRQGKLICAIVDGNGTKALFGKEEVCELQEYRQGRLEGQIKGFDKQGRVCRHYHVKNNCKHGEELCFFDAPPFQKTLVTKMSMNWYEGKIQGVTKTWYDNGIQESQREISSNKKNGHSTAWYRDGSLMMIEEYVQDKLERGEYFSRGEKFPISTVLNGEGDASIFDSEGNFEKKVPYKHGKPIVDE